MTIRLVRNKIRCKRSCLFLLRINKFDKCITNNGSKIIKERERSYEPDQVTEIVVIQQVQSFFADFSRSGLLSVGLAADGLY